MLYENITQSNMMLKKKPNKHTAERIFQMCCLFANETKAR